MTFVTFVAFLALAKSYRERGATKVTKVRNVPRSPDEKKFIDLSSAKVVIAEEIAIYEA